MPDKQLPREPRKREDYAGSMTQDSSSAVSPSALDSASLRAVAIAAAQATGPGLRSAFRGGVTSREKTNAHDLVTDFDEDTERILADYLLNAYPESTFWGEEDTQSHSAGIAELEWIVDPIDGTSNFVHGIALFSVSIAATINQELVAAVVYDPIAEIVFSADEFGAYINDTKMSREDDASQPLRSDERSLSLLTDYPSAEAIAEDGPLALEAFGDLVTTFATVRRPVSSAQSLAHVAAGWSDVWFGFGLKAWDIAAGAFIVQQAGGHFEAIGDATADTLAQRISEDDDVHPLTAPAYFALGPGVESETTYGWITRILEHRQRG